MENEEVFRLYWCGPLGEFNADSLEAFSDAASKIWNGLEPYAYLRYLFTELPKAETVEAIEALLPGNLAKDQLNIQPT
jgi:hypothetical protein